MIVRFSGFSLALDRNEFRVRKLRKRGAVTKLSVIQLACYRVANWLALRRHGESDLRARCRLLRGRLSVRSPAEWVTLHTSFPLPRRRVRAGGRARWVREMQFLTMAVA